MNIIHVEDTKILDEFYDNWDLTFEGTTTDSDNLKFLIDWFKKHNVNMKKEDFYVVKGSLMNTHYNLTRDNAYPDDCNLLIIKLKDLENASNIFVPRFQLGGRWFTDIVDNNAKRENHN